MRMHHVSFFSSVHLDWWQHDHSPARHWSVLAFRARFRCRDEWMMRVIQKWRQQICSHSTAADKWRRGDLFHFNQCHLHCLQCIYLCTTSWIITTKHFIGPRLWKHLYGLTSFINLARFGASLVIMMQRFSAPYRFSLLAGAIYLVPLSTWL